MVGGVDSAVPPRAGALPRSKPRLAVDVVRRLVAAVVGGTRFGGSVLWMFLRNRHVDPAHLGLTLRRFLETMGFTYLKVGQFLALRFDILPAEVCEELGKLFDRAPPVDFGHVRHWIEAELGGPLEEFFLDVEATPVAAASLAQVHRATARDGEPLALKIQRPNARRDFEADMLLARWIARAVNATGLLRSLSLVSLLDEFEGFTRRELDFDIEGRVAMKVGARVAPGVAVPTVRFDLTTPRMLAMEFIEGVRLGTAIKLTKAGRREELEELLPGVELGGIVRAIALESLREILVDGLFHADPHPGNILVRRDGTVVYVDFGMFGYLTPAQRRNCSGYIENAALNQPERSFTHFFRLVIPTPDLNRPAFQRDMVLLMRDWAEWTSETGGDIVDRHLGTIMLRTLNTMRVNGTRLDTDLLLFWRVLFVLDSMALDLADHVDLIGIMKEFFEAHSSPVRRQLDRLTDNWLPDMASCRKGVAATAAQARRSPERCGRVVVLTRRSRARRIARTRRVSVLAVPILLTAAAVLARG
jgi:ubiquinone biosynthesis protein